jgi:hypothetical protein
LGVLVALRELKSTAPLLGATLAGCPWWLLVAVGALTIFLHGADPAMHWLDVWDRIRGRRPTATRPDRRNPRSGRPRGDIS